MLVRLAIIFIIAAVTAACRHESAVADDTGHRNIALPGDTTATYQFDGNHAPEPPGEPVNEYPGKTIDQIFPLNVENDFSRGNGERTHYKLSQAGFDINVFGFAPDSLAKNGKELLRLRTDSEKESYHSIALGQAKLTGEDSDQIYMVSLGPGAVCCTNYWIVDITSRKPRLIFRSEQFGSFRDPMEIFDADGDGIYELMQFDSCFRYFMDDCGSCSPEPRAYFKYDKAGRQYLPVAGIAQNFIREGHQRSDQWLAEKHDELQRTGDVGLSLDIRRSALAHIVDLLFIGEERKAWKVFDKYIDDPKGETRREINRRLAGCKFYQSLKRR